MAKRRKSEFGSSQPLLKQNPRKDKRQTNLKNEPEDHRVYPNPYQTILTILNDSVKKKLKM